MPTKMPSGTSRLALFLPLAVALFGVVAALLAIYSINHRFFFIDDRQAQYFPYGLVIKDMLLHGSFPLLTTRTFFGGALWLDPQNAIFNPLSLLMTLLIDPGHLQISGLLYAVAGSLLLTGGAYALGRAYQLTPSFAALLGFMMSTNLYILYFSSADWHPGLLSLGWLLFAWAAMKRLVDAEENMALRILGCAILIFLTVSSGWPHQDVALAVVMAALFIEALFQSRARALRLVWTGALAAAFCMPVVVPVLAALPWTARESGIIHNGLFAPTFGGVLNFSNPAWRPNVTLFRADQSIPFPFFFTAWYALPIAAFLNFRAIRPWPAAILCMTGVFLLLSCCTGQIGPLRFPMRWLPNIHVGLLLSLFLAVKQARFIITSRRICAALASLVVTTLLALLDNQAEAVNAMRLVLLTAVFILLLPEMLGRRQGLPLYLGFSSVVLVLLMVSGFPDIFDDPGKSNSGPAAPAQRRDAPAEYTLYSGPARVLEGKGGEEEYLPAAMGAYYGINTVNGYSSLAHRNWTEVFRCSGYETARCGFPVPPLLRRAPETKAPYLDLLKVDEIVAEKVKPAELASRALSPEWRRTADIRAVRFTRPASKLPGTVSWHSASMAMPGPSELTGAGETVSLRNDSDKPGLVVFAREYYPGFHASLDGMELKPRPVDALFVGVDIPPRASGALRLSFMPPLLIPSVLAALGGLPCWSIFFFMSRAKTKSRPRRRAALFS